MEEEKKILFKPLIIVPSPRDIEEVKNAQNTIPFIKLWIKNHTAREAYPIFLNEFLKRKAFTHLIITPDDLVVPYSTLRLLIEDVKSLPEELKDSCIVSGYCNINTTDKEYLSNISFNVAHIERPKRASYEAYHFQTMEQMKNINNIPIQKFTKFNPNLIRVGFSGLAAWIIPRKIIEDGILSFKNDSPSGRDESGCCYDVVACWELYHADIPVFVDVRANFRHLRQSTQAITSFHLQGKPKEVYLESIQIRTTKHPIEDFDATYHDQIIVSQQQ